jgi:hypothetical protein
MDGIFCCRRHGNLSIELSHSLNTAKNNLTEVFYVVDFSDPSYPMNENGNSPFNFLNIQDWLHLNFN